MNEWYMYAIADKDDNFWFNVAAEEWVDEFELKGDCLFPTYELAKQYTKNKMRDASIIIYKVRMQVKHSYQCEPLG